MDLGKHNGYTFKVSNEFKGEYLVPIIDNLKVKYRDFMMTMMKYIIVIS